MNFSIVIPLYNEEQNINNLIQEIFFHLKNIEFKFEILLVNDASTDNSHDVLQNLKNKYKDKVIIINNNINLGQSFSLIKGIEKSRYKTIVTLDGDGQNNPKDILHMLDLLLKKHDSKIVCGIRKNRRDNSIRIISSKLANFVRKLYLGDDCDDTGCSLKIFNKKLFLKIPYFDGIHRFIPALFNGMRIRPLYIEVDHRPRLHGNSKYGISNRLFKGIADMYKVKKMIKNFKND